MEKINVQVPQSLLARLDEVWEERGYANKSEFIPDALRDGVNLPTQLSEEALEQLTRAVIRIQSSRSCLLVPYSGTKRGENAGFAPCIRTTFQQLIELYGAESMIFFDDPCRNDHTADLRQGPGIAFWGAGW